METIANHSTEPRAGFSPKRTQNRVLFVATCRKCQRQVLQRGYSRVLLFAYLDVEHEIEAHCVVCDDFWPISAEERRAIVDVLAPAYA